MLERIKEGRLKGIKLYGGITSEDLHLDELKADFNALHYHNYFDGRKCSATGIASGTTSYVPLQSSPH